MDYEALIQEREAHAAQGDVALQAQVHKLQKRISDGWDWLLQNKEHPDWEKQRERHDALVQQEQELYHISLAFRFPFKKLWFTLPEGMTWGKGRTEITMVRDLREHIPDVSGANLDGLWLPGEARALLARIRPPAEEVKDV